MKPKSKHLRRLGYLGLGLLLSAILLYLLFLRPTPIKVGGFTSSADENTMIPFIWSEAKALMKIPISNSSIFGRCR